MPLSKTDRETLIKYIMNNDKTFSKEDFLVYTNTQLVLIKVRIELENIKKVSPSSLPD
jgi:hypothetical protein